MRSPSTRRVSLLRTFVLGAGLSCAAGCLGGSSGPELVDVSGVVTLDSKPLADATVTFSPETQAGTTESRPAQARTDQNGRYALHYSSSKSGTPAGKYKVSIFTFRRPDEDKDGNEVPGAAETVPEVYNAKSTLTAEVSADKPTHNFDLKSDAGPLPSVRPETPDE